MGKLEDEIDRQYRLTDQLMTMHSVLRDTYAKRSRTLAISLLAGSAILNAFVFVNDDVFTSLGVDSGAAKVGIGVSSITLFVLSLIDLKMDYSAKVRAHETAVGKLSSLKFKYREVHAQSKTLTADDFHRLTAEYTHVTDLLPPIPESQFNRLKKKHLMKRVLSQRLDHNPKLPIWIVRLSLLWEGVREFYSRRPK